MGLSLGLRGPPSQTQMGSVPAGQVLNSGEPPDFRFYVYLRH